MKVIKNSAFALAGLLLLSACGEVENKKNAREMGNTETAENLEVEAPASMDKAENTTLNFAIEENDQFDTLLLALEKADLRDILNEEMEHTVFAPTDAAFNVFPDEKLEALFHKENEAELINTLSYHILPGTHTLADIEERIKANDGTYTPETLHGKHISFSKENGSIVLTDVQGNSAAVVTSEIKASNGLIYGIDKLMSFN